MLVSLQRSDQQASSSELILTYSVQRLTSSGAIGLDGIVAQDGAHLVVFVPSIDGTGLDDAECLKQNAARLDGITGDDIVVTLPFVEGAANIHPLHVAESIRKSMTEFGHKPPSSTFALYLERHRADDGTVDLVGFSRALPELNTSTLDALASAWRKGADKLRADPDVRPGSFYRAVHGGILPSKIGWILALSEAMNAVLTLKRWLTQFR